MNVSILNKISLSSVYEGSYYSFSNLLFQLLNFRFQFLLGILYGSKVVDSPFQFCIFISQALELSFVFYGFCDLDSLILDMKCAEGYRIQQRTKKTNNCRLKEWVWIGGLRENFIDMEEGVVRGLGALCKAINFGLIG